MPVQLSAGQPNYSRRLIHVRNCRVVCYDQMTDDRSVAHLDRSTRDVRPHPFRRFPRIDYASMSHPDHAGDLACGHCRLTALPPQRKTGPDDRRTGLGTPAHNAAPTA